MSSKENPSAESPAPTKAVEPKEPKTPAEWAALKGHTKPSGVPWRTDHVDPRYAAADALHGWAHHAYHFADKPLLITEAQYDEALEIAAAFPCRLPKSPALSPHCPHKLPEAPAAETPKEKA